MDAVGRKLGNSEFEELMYVHYPEILKICWRILNHKHLAEDATQQTFFHAWFCFHEFRGEANVKSWLTRIAKNEAFDILRKRKCRPELSLDEDCAPVIASSGDDPYVQVVAVELKREFGLALEKLAPKYRAVLLLKYRDELRDEDVAQELGLTVPATKTRARRGRLEIRRQFIVKGIL
jgi:RNA polymerase sigma-70 factor (ECF subfamily)